MKKVVLNYISTFKGLSTEVWWLAFITLINRAGTMVIPFLSIYLNEHLNFSKEEVGLVMLFFGLGSVCGSWIGGKLTDKLGYYKVMFGSLLLTGILFFGLQFLSTFREFCFGIFIVMTFGDTFRPAVFTALNAYSKEENKTRSLTLIRLAINLGFSAGPAVGGLIIVSLSFAGLFWVDAITCILASLLLLKVLHPKKAKELDSFRNQNPKSVYTDFPYWIFFFAMVIFGFIFVQFFSTVPLFYKEFHKLPEDSIGLILGMNGFIIFLTEMPLVSYFEKKKIDNITSIIVGLALTSLSFGIMLWTFWEYSVVVSMIVLTFGEMIAFPFSNAFAVKRAKRGNFGEYMGMYSVSISLAHIFAHFSGMMSISKIGYTNTWIIMFTIGIAGIALLFVLKSILQKETEVQLRESV
ncbi:Predicted arabinose efflux permease, MFS family [Pustulibacterium marinum]|uniref:Predicted arabinose efflux permease, MFS family n=1 Tax=Pustulibacterium marinum TaxID=1224947 RepID=A0A1I7FCZ7_9FLAO|nr:MFS transporter [Pustulibacterium marinum]SFU33966.1 Predicted arabinose efflux permease, MFS family [Pustulibacterium marinum]